MTSNERNPYQRIPGIQQGHIDTSKKFEELVAGIDLEGLSVLDVGCNLGEMSRLAVACGARSVRGIDERIDYIRDAERLTTQIFSAPKLHQFVGRTSFAVQDGYRVTGRYDLAIVSAAFHYFRDPERLLAQLARVARKIRLDVWVAPEASDEGMIASQRGLRIPSAVYFRESLARLSWEKVEELGPALAPDGSTRIVYELSEPREASARARLIYGAGGTGKSTRARELVNLGWVHYQLDQAFLDWRMTHMNEWWSIPWVEQALRGEFRKGYRRFFQQRITRFVRNNYGLDMVVEGYSAMDDELRASIVSAILYALETVEGESPNVLYGDVEEVRV